MSKRHELIALIDMDGTVADFDGQMTADLQSLTSPAEKGLVTDPSDAEDPAWLKARKRMIKTQPGWWRNLPTYAPGLEILRVLLDEDFDLMVLSKGPFEATQAWSEKAEWCRKNLPGVPVTVTEDKGLVYGKVLVDDWPAYGIRWLDWRPRGLLIVPAHRWNTLDKYPAKLHRNIIRYTGGQEQRDQIASRLRVIREYSEA